MAQVGSQIPMRILSGRSPKARFDWIALNAPMEVWPYSSAMSQVGSQIPMRISAAATPTPEVTFSWSTEPDLQNFVF